MTDRTLIVENVTLHYANLLTPHEKMGYVVVFPMASLPEEIKQDLKDYDFRKFEDGLIRVGAYVNKRPIIYFDDSELDTRSILASYSFRSIELAFCDVPCRLVLSTRFQEADRRMGTKRMIVVRVHAVDFNSEALEKAVRIRQKELIRDADAFSTEDDS